MQRVGCSDSDACGGEAAPVYESGEKRLQVPLEAAGAGADQSSWRTTRISGCVAGEAWTRCIESYRHCLYEDRRWVLEPLRGTRTRPARWWAWARSEPARVGVGVAP